MQINDLYRAAIKGDESAEGRLFALLDERFQRFVRLRVWDKDNAEDIVQEALLTISREFRHIQIEKSFAAWAYTLLNNRIAAHLKNVSRRRTVSSENIEQVRSQSTEVDPPLKIRLIRCLRKLHRVNRRYARVLNLHRQGYRAEEIGERMGLSRNGVYILLSRARAVLKDCIAGGEE